MRIALFLIATLFGVATASAGSAAPCVASEGIWTTTIGIPFRYQIVASNNPTKFAATATLPDGSPGPLPNGLTLDPSTGVISGTPTTSGMWALNLSATNGSGMGTAILTLGVNPDIEKGGDISDLQQMTVVPPTGANSNTQPFIFYDTNGQTLDPDPETNCLKIIKAHGIDMIRLHVYVPPIVAPNYDVQISGNCTIEEFAPLCQKAFNLGLKVYMDLGCSWTYSQPGGQAIPVDWGYAIAGMSHDQAVAKLSLLLANHVTDVLTRLKTLGVTPTYVSIGNEITSGMLLSIYNYGYSDHPTAAPFATNPAGIQGAGSADLAAFLNAGYTAVKNFDPNIEVVNHIDRAHSLGISKSFYDGLVTRNAHWDICGPDDGASLSSESDVAQTMKYCGQQYHTPGQGGDGPMMTEVDVNGGFWFTNYNDPTDFDLTTQHLNLMRAVPGSTHGTVFYNLVSDADWRGWCHSYFCNHMPTNVLNAYQGSILYAQGNQIIGNSGQAVQLQGVNLGGWLVMDPSICPADSSGKLPSEDEYNIVKALDARFGVAEEQSIINNYRQNWISEVKPNTVATNYGTNNTKVVLASGDLANIQSKGLNLVRVPVWWGDFYNLSAEDSGTVAFTSPLTAKGTVGAPFTYIVTIANPATITAFPLPAGLTFNSSTGVISGTPSAVGTTQVKLTSTATGSSDTGAQTLSITISTPATSTSPVSSAPLLSGSTMLTASSSTYPIKFQIVASNPKPVSYSASNLPSFMSIDTSSGLISTSKHADGTYFANVPGTYDITVSATNTVVNPSTGKDVSLTNYTGISLIVTGTNPLPAIRTDLYNGFAYLDALINKASELGIYTLIDMHGAFGGQNSSASTGQANQNKYWANQNGEQAKTQALWTAIAAHYSGNAWVAGYDLLNEPTGAPNLAAVIQQYSSLYNAIRVVDPKHIIFMQCTGSWGTLPDPASQGWTNVVYETHDYPTDPSATGVENAAVSQKSSYNVPSYVGEFTAYENEPTVWSAIINDFNSMGLSWSSWTYKAINEGSTKEPSLYIPVQAPPPIPNIVLDTEDTISSDWSNWSTTNAFAANTTSTAPTLVGSASIISPAQAFVTSGSPFSYIIRLGGGNTGAPYNITATATSYNATNLPSGLSINTTTGIISGTPASSGNNQANVYNISLSAQTNLGPCTGNLTLVVNPPTQVPVVTSTTGTYTAGKPFTYTITATNKPTSYSAVGLPAGLTIDAATGVISGIPTGTTIPGTATTSPDTTVALIAANQWGTGYGTLELNPPPVITSASTVTGKQGVPFSYTITGTNSPNSFHAYCEPSIPPEPLPKAEQGQYPSALPAGLSLDPSTGIISGIPTATYSGTIVIEAGNSGGSSTAASLNVTINKGSVTPRPPVISSAATAGGTVGTAFSYSITASNNPTSFNATGLPSGLSISTTTGVISGIPTATGTSMVTLDATNAGGTGSSTLTLTVESTPAAPVISSAATASGTVGAAFTYTITASNNPTSFNATGLPSGLSISTTTGVISGTPTATGSSMVTLGATNSGGTGTKTLTLTVGSTLPAPVISSAAAASGTVGTAFTYTITASNNPTSFNATGLPSGLSISTTTGVISGTPTATGTSMVTLDATNAGGTGTKTLTLTVNPPPAPVISSAAAASGTVGTAFTYTITASNNPTSYNATGLPSGLSISTTTGVISGTPTATGTSMVTLDATNAGGTGTKTLTLTVNHPAPVISSAAAASGTVGTAFTYTITASNNPTSFNATGLPSGLSISTTTGVISGTPTATGTSMVTLDATNAGGTGTKTLTLTVNPPAPVISSAATASGTVGTAFTYSITASNNPTSYNATGLPSGLSISTTTGVISGTPTATGTSMVTLDATNAGGTGTKTLTLTVNPPAPVISSAATASGTVGAAFTYSITASNNPTSFNATGLPSGLSISTTTGVISGTPTATGTSMVTLGATNAGGTGTKTLTLTVNPPAPVISSAATASGTVGAAFTYSITASNNPTSFNATGLPSGLSISTTTGVISGTPTATGTSMVTLGATNAGGTGTKTLTLTVNPPAPVISSAAAASGTVGTAFTYTITASNNPTSYNATGLPSGLSISTTTGVISGTPTATGTSMVTLGATNAGGTGTKTLTLTVNPPAPVISSAAAASGTVGTAFTYTITASNNPTSFNATGLPSGLSISTTTGVISGTPTATGTSMVTLDATNAGGTGTKTLTLTVNPPAPVISSAATAGGTVGTAFTYSITASNNPTSFNATGLPSGLSISTTTGVISGTPTATGTSMVTLDATNAGGTGTKTLTLTVNPPAPVISSAATASGTVGAAFTYSITASNNPTSYNATGLPSGLSISTTTGVISGTPTATGTSMVTLGATNAGGTGTKTLTLTVNPPAPVISSAATASGTVGTAFTYTITASNNPTSFNATGLPSGLSISTTTGVISGTPTATGTSMVTLGATNAGGTGTKTLTLTVNPPAPVISSAATASGTVGAAFTYSITASNNPTSYNATGLPSGLSISTTTGVISGTPTATGTSMVTLGATNAGGTGTKTLTLTVNPPAPVISSAAAASGTVGTAFTYTITASNNPTSFNATGLPSGLSISTTTGVISGTPTATGTSMVTLGATNAGGTGTKTLTLTVNPPAPVISSAATASGTVGTAFTYTITASNNPTSFNATGLPSGLSISTTTGVISGTPTATGTSMVTLGATNAGGTGTKTLTLTVNPPAPVISSAAAASGTVGTAFTYTITASNNPTSFNATGLPSGLSISTTTGVISGTPTATGTSMVTLGATNAGGTGTKTLTLTVNPPAPVISSAATASGTVGTAFTYTITASNNPTSFNATGLPSGLSISTTTGVISGTPTATGTSMVTLGATNAGGTGTKTLTLTVNPPAPVISSAATASGTVGTAFTYTITASNNPTSFNATGLPSGLSISTTTGVISGTPTATGTSMVTLGATNAGGTGTKTLTLTVSPSGYDSWIASFGMEGLNASPSATPFNDGVPNLLKYVFGVDPTRPMTSADRAALPQVGLDDTSTSNATYLTLTFGQSHATTGLAVGVQISTDLQNWSSSALVVGLGLPTDSMQYSEQPTGKKDPNGDPYMKIEVLVPDNVAKEFIRLSVPVPTH